MWLPRLDTKYFNAELAKPHVVRVELPQGEYRLDEPIYIPPGTQLRGHANGTTLWNSSGNVAVFCTSSCGFFPSMLNMRIRPMEDYPMSEKEKDLKDNPVEIWSELCRRAEDAVASAAEHRQAETAFEWAQMMTQMANHIAGVACPRCNGIGSYSYASTSTWRGGMGGASITVDVCDVCWGTGRTDKKGPNRRKIEAHARDLEAKSSRQWFEQNIGAELGSMRQSFEEIAGKLRRARWSGFSVSRAAEVVAGTLEEIVQEKDTD